MLKKANKLTKILNRFIRQLEEEKELRNKAFSLQDTYEEEKELKAVLHCMTAEDSVREIQKNVLTYKKKQGSNPLKNYLKYYDDLDSHLWKNALLNAEPLCLHWLKISTKNNALPNSDFKNYPFWPRKNESLLSFLKHIRKFINNSDSTDYYNRLARDLFPFLLEDLFEKINFSEDEKNRFLHTEKIITKRDKQWTPLILNPGRFPIDQFLCKNIIELCINKYLASQNHIYAELLLFIWIAQAAARNKRRSFTVSDFLKICPQHIQEDSWDKNKTLSKKITVNKIHFPISLTLNKITMAYGYNKKSTEPIFLLDRSTIENYLKKITEELKKTLPFDPELSPITPETFLEEVIPHIKRRYVPKKPS